MAAHPHRPRRPGPSRPARTDAPSGGEVDRWVRVTCPACGVVRVRLEDVVLRNCLDDRSWSYRARCSRCHMLFLADTPVSLAMPAVAAGVRVEQWRRPVPSPNTARGPIRDVDAVELHLALMRPGWIDELARGGTAPEGC